MEAWKTIPGYEGVYEVSDLGRVRSVNRIDALGRTKRSVVLKQGLDDKGRPCVGLQSKTYRVSVLVLTAFVGTKPQGMEGCHYDGDPTNNTLSNLRWDTRSANTKDVVAHGTNASTRKTHCPQGHLLEEGNLVLGALARGHRHCLICHREKSLAAYHRKKAIKAKVAV